MTGWAVSPVDAPADAPGVRIAGLILAGGAGRRMGGADKALLRLQDRPLLLHVADRFAPQVDDLALSANGDLARFSPFGWPVLPDAGDRRDGPLAGLLAGLTWAATQGASHLATVSVDTPFLPCDLVPRLLLAAGTAQRVAVAESGGRLHPTCGLWPAHIRPALEAALDQGERRIGRWAESLGAAAAHFGERPDPFFNINRPEDLAEAEALWRTGQV